MLLNNCELTPAVILSVDDPKKLGRIKCIIPGIIDSSTMSEENIPWCYPFSMSRYQSFSKCIPGQKVWVLINKSNYNEYWYLPFFEYNEISKNHLEEVYDNDNPEIFMSRCLGENNAMSTYDDKNGFSEKIGDHHIDLHPEGHVSIVGGDGQVDINGGIVTLGNKDKGVEPTIKGTTFMDHLKTINAALNAVMGGQKAGQPVDASLVAALTIMNEQFKLMIGDSLTEYVKVN